MTYLFMNSKLLQRSEPRPGSKHGLAGCWLLLLIGLVCGGCDSESFVPARPAELGGSNAGLAGGTSVTTPTTSQPFSSTALHSGARAIELIAGPRSPDDSALLKLTARAMAGREKSRILISVMGEADAPGTEQELVRKAITRDPLALIVEPVDPADKELAKAVGEAQARGLPVVVMGRALTGFPSALAQVSDLGKAAGPAIAALVSVVPEPFANSARPLVEAAIRNARNAKLSPDAAVLMINASADRLSEDRAGPSPGVAKHRDHGGRADAHHR